jgi:hypothetical protein
MYWPEPNFDDIVFNTILPDFSVKKLSLNMSGTAPNDPAPGGHSSAVEQTPLDSNQHGQAQYSLSNRRSILLDCLL